MLTLVVNDVPRHSDAETVAQLLGELTVPPRGVAVALNGELVRRAEWSERRLSDGDRLEVLTAAQGG